MYSSVIQPCLPSLIILRISMAAAAVIGVVFVALLSVFYVNWRLDRSSGCHFPAIYNFGDSNSDTGSVSAILRRVPFPNGQNFGKPSGRYSDGRLIIDFIAENLGLPCLNAYLDSIGTSFRHGANFAATGSTIQPPHLRMFEEVCYPLFLNIQLLQFAQFKARTTQLYPQVQNSDIKSTLPRPEDFSKALYTMDTGQNDLHDGFTSMTVEQVQKSIPNIINQFSQAIEQLYQQGAKIFWIHNTGPIGCSPFFVINYPPKPDNVDQTGCIKSYNEVAQEFNRQLKDMVSQLRSKLGDALLTYVDIYSAKYSLISEAKIHGFVDPFGQCCGQNGKFRECGKKAVVNGTEVDGASCTNPSEYISWDGIHYTDVANQWVAGHILNGSLSDPPLPISEACHNPLHLEQKY